MPVLLIDVSLPLSKFTCFLNVPCSLVWSHLMWDPYGIPRPVFTLSFAHLHCLQKWWENAVQVYLWHRRYEPQKSSRKWNYNLKTKQNNKKQLGFLQECVLCLEVKNTAGFSHMLLSCSSWYFYLVGDCLRVSIIVIFRWFHLILQHFFHCSRSSESSLSLPHIQIFISSFLMTVLFFQPSLNMLFYNHCSFS